MDIKETLGEELYQQVVDKIGDKKILINDGQYIPKVKFDEKNEELKATKLKLDEMQVNLQKLGESNQEAETFKIELNKIKEEYEQFKSQSESRLMGYKKKQAVEKGLMKENVNPETIDLLLTQFNLDNIKLDEQDNIVDWDAHINPIKQSRKTLFASEQIVGEKPQTGTKPIEQSALKLAYQDALKNNDRLGAIKIKQEAYKKGEYL